MIGGKRGRLADRGDEITLIQPSDAGRTGWQAGDRHLLRLGRQIDESEEHAIGGAIGQPEKFIRRGYLQVEHLSRARAGHGGDDMAERKHPATVVMTH